MENVYIGKLLFNIVTYFYNLNKQWCLSEAVLLLLNKLHQPCNSNNDRQIHEVSGKQTLSRLTQSDSQMQVQTIKQSRSIQQRSCNGQQQ